MKVRLIQLMTAYRIEGFISNEWKSLDIIVDYDTAFKRAKKYSQYTGVDMIIDNFNDGEEIFTK